MRIALRYVVKYLRGFIMFHSITRGKVQKLRGSGVVEFEVSIDDTGRAFVSIVDNSDAGTFAGGTHFPMPTVMELRAAVSATRGPVWGIRDDGTEVSVGDLNVPGFLKAIGQSLAG
jgi:hypothetical protein